jgi:two-component system, OmpR family, sensor histidine kinase MtrB
MKIQLRERTTMRRRIATIVSLAVVVAMVALTLTTWKAVGNSSYLVQKLRDIFIIADGAGLLLAVGLGWLVGWQIGRPIRRAAETAREFGAGDLNARMPETGRTELRDLAEAFNDMAAQLQQALTDLQDAHDQQRQFTADVSHELRTPLAAMLAAADGMSSHDPITRARAGELLVGQTRRLTRMVDDLLEISRFDAREARLETEEVRLDDLTQDAVHTVAPDASVRLTKIGDIVAWVDVRRVHAILRNLISNAVRHGCPPIEIVLDGRDPSSVTLTVADAGPGIDPQLAPVIFRRFVRGDRSRSTRQGDANTTGLGLAIADENARLHGGSITLSTHGQTAFTLHLPRRPAADGVDPPAATADEVPTVVLASRY